MAAKKLEAAIHETPAAAATATVAPKPEPKTRISAESLKPPLQDSVSVTKQYTYWIGVTSDCPGNFLTCGGINFPKITDKMEPDPMKPGSQRRIPEIGCLHPLTQRQMESIIENIPFCVIRFQEPREGQEGKPRKGYPVRIPSPARIEKAKKHGTALPQYIQQPGDEWAAKYMFAVLCDDQENPLRGTSYPPTLAEAGLEWPDEMEH